MAKIILIVDDEEAVRNLIKMQLGKQDYEFLEAHDLETAYSSMKSKRPDLVILDVKLNGDDVGGLGVLAVMRNEPDLKDVRVLVISGRADRDEISFGFQSDMGATNFLSKPWTARELRDRVALLLK